jgi:hypothetical protein
VQDGSKFPVRPKDGDHWLGPYPLLPSGPCWKSYSDDLPFQMNLHLLYSPLDPTSNEEGGSTGENAP